MRISGDVTVYCNGRLAHLVPVPSSVLALLSNVLCHFASSEAAVPGTAEAADFIVLWSFVSPAVALDEAEEELGAGEASHRMGERAVPVATEVDDSHGIGQVRRIRGLPV